MAVFEDAVVCGDDVVRAAEIGGQTGVGGELSVKGEDYAVVEDLVCECIGEGGWGVCVLEGFTDDEHAGEVFEHAPWAMRESCQSSALTSDHSSTTTTWGLKSCKRKHSLASPRPASNGLRGTLVLNPHESEMNPPLDHFF